MKSLQIIVTVLLSALTVMLVNAKAYAEPFHSAQRIIALSPHSVEILFLIGAGDRIVGTTEFADYPEQAKKIPRIGGYNGIQIDRVLELEPDIVIAWQSGNPEKDIARIKELGIPVYESKTKNLEDIPREIINISKHVGLADEGKKQASNYSARLNALRARYADRAPVSFFYQLWSKPLRTMAAGSWIDAMFRGCGAKNVFDDMAQEYPQVSLEAVIERKPEVIVVPTHHGGEIAVEMWQNWPEIPAIKNERIVFVDGDLLHRFSYRTLDGMQTVCETFDQIRAERSAL